MSLDIYINEELLQLKENKGIGLTFQIGSIFNPGNRAGNLSNNFKVPKTRRNTEILGNLSNINSATDIPYQRNTAKIIQDGIEIFPGGFAIIESTGSEYKITVYSGNVSFFNLIKGANISDLDFSDLSLDWTVSNVIASFNNTEGIIFPIVDWGEGVQLLNNTTLNNSNALIPVLFLKDVLTRISDSVGYEIKGTFPDSEQWDRLLLTPNQFGYTTEEQANNTGVSKDITTIPLTDVVVNSICSFAPIIPPDYFLNIPLVYQDINGTNFNQVTGDDFTPDNTYFGAFNLYARGFFNTPFLPIKGEKILQQGTLYNDFKSPNINDDFVSWINKRSAFSEQKVWIQDLNDDSPPLEIASNSFNQNGISAMTETNGGYVAYSLGTSGQTDVFIYEISTATTTQIYLNALGSGIVDFLKIWNGKVIINDRDINGGLFVYDIGTTTLKTVTTTNDTGAELDSNGDFVVWEQPSSNDIFIWDYATATNLLIENQGAFSGINTCHVLGDYATYWDEILDKMVSYKISTATLTNILTDAGTAVTGSARTSTKLGFAKQSGQLYYYDLVTDTLTTPPGETNCTVQGVGQIVDQYIDMNEDWIVYRYQTNNQINAYNINTLSAITVATETGQIDYVKIGQCNDLTTHHVGGTVDQIKQFDITSGAPILFDTLNNINTVVVGGMQRAIGNDRLVFTNDFGVGSSTLDKVSLLQPVPNQLTPKIEIVIKENGVPMYTDSVTLTTTQPNNLFILTINTGTIIVNSGDVYTAELFIEANRDETINYVLQYELNISEFSFTAYCSIPYGAKLRIENFYNFDQDKIYKDLMNLYGLTIQTDEVTKQIFLTPLDILNDNLSKSVNWNEKINPSRTPVVKYKLGSYGQTNYFNYKKDDDVPEDLGRGSFNINDFQLPLTKDIIKLNSSAVESDFRILNEVTPTIPFQVNEGSCFDKKNPRILLLDKVVKNSDWENTLNSDVGSATVLPLCYFQKDGKLDNLDFTSLINENYNVLTGIMDQFKFISAGFKLTEVDISNLDFTIPIYLDVHYSEIHINGYFYINKISNFKKNENTKVDLIRL
jgi:hypothetical protein